jgi:hypothetical protein
MQQQMCYMGQEKVFEQASECFIRLTGVDVNAKQIERLCHHYGNLLEEKQWQSIASGENASKKNDRQSYYAMLDGGMILTREEKWKEMKLARIFDRRSRTSISKERGYIGSSTYVAHLGGCKDFLQKIEYHLDTKGEIIFIADGAPWIWKWVEAMYPESTQILDFYHAKQHLCQWAELAIKNPHERIGWIDTQTEWILNNQIDKVIERIKKMPAYYPKTKQCKKALIEYYTTHRDRMQYKTYREHGRMIGSGPIEAAHRHVVQQRMKLSGQRWTIKGAQQVANLRVAFKNEQWDQVIALTSRASKSRLLL